MGRPYFPCRAIDRQKTTVVVFPGAARRHSTRFRLLKSHERLANRQQGLSGDDALPVISVTIKRITHLASDQITLGTQGITMRMQPRISTQCLKHLQYGLRPKFERHHRNFSVR